MRSPMLVATSPVTVKEVLISKFSNFHDNELGMYVDEKVDPIFSKNPFLLKGNDWKEKRAEITPAFTVSRVFIGIIIQSKICLHSISSFTVEDDVSDNRKCVQFNGGFHQIRDEKGQS